MSERLLKTLRKSGDFQAEYEGSIPFTRSNFSRLCATAGFHSDNPVFNAPFDTLHWRGLLA
jgi:hypothetical protein